MQHQLKSNFSAVKTPRQTTCTAQSQPRAVLEQRKKPYVAKKKSQKIWQVKTLPYLCTRN